MMMSAQCNNYLLLIVLLISIISFTECQSQRIPNTKTLWWERRAREQGPNVCAIEKVVGTNRRYFSPWSGGDICSLPTVISLECCEGFTMLESARGGCPLNKPLVNLIESVRDNGVSALGHAIRESGLTKSLATDGPYTLFAPVNNAFLNASEELIYSLNRKTAMQGTPPSLLMYHLAPSRIFYGDLENEMLVPTLYYRQPLRINKFQNGLVTVNCIPLVSIDLEATNGVVHTIESILTAPSQNAIADHVVREPLLSRMATILVQSKMTSFLREKGPFTLFVPTDDAFNQLPQDELEIIMKDSDALIALVKHHIVEGVWCTSSITDKGKLKTQEGSELLVSCNATHKFVNDAVILQNDIPVTNGFIHIIDQVLVPQTAKSLRQIAEELELTTLLSLMQLSALENVLTNNGKFTIIAPSDSAFEVLSNETIHELLSDAGVLQDVLMAHLVPNIYHTQSLIDQQSLSTLKLQHRLRVKINRKRTTIEGSEIQSANNEGRNGIIHVIDRVLFPPKMTIAQYLMKNNYSNTFVTTLNATSPPLLDLLASGRGPFTVFAPDDYSLSLLPPGHLARMAQLPEVILRVMNDHIVEDFITTKGLIPRIYYSYRTRGQNSLMIQDEDGLVTVGIAAIKEPDIICTNGIVHRINRLIQLN